MSDPGTWVRVRNYDQFFIHYGGKRPPIWIKLYNDFLHQDAFMDLTLAERGLLVGIWQLEAQNRCNGRPNQLI